MMIDASATTAERRTHRSQEEWYSAAEKGTVEEVEREEDWGGRG